ncbi:alpha/beta hydrolase [Chryseobacterium koreense]|uniref:alpha/beta hydrolase n=1 Tax=Chryseobacterium koreense TaxID=232216 RepID=UPI0026EE59F6|nr:alpha/beta hydrolase [Chryseobacterium koreense]
MNKTYIFSGLGVDRRVFDNIDFSGFNVEFIDWIDPRKNESLTSYATRVSKKIIDQNPTLIGLSFGGIVAVEIAKIIKVKKVILIASAKTKYELPKIYRIAGKLRLNKFLPMSILKKQHFFINWMFGVQNKTEKRLLKTILKETNPYFLTWAINEIANWKNENTIENTIHIHGNKDRIIPIKNVKSNFIIENGGHFMTVNKAKEIEKILKRELEANA